MSTSRIVSGETRTSWPGLAFSRVFSRAGVDPLKAVVWEQRAVDGGPVMVEVPADWPSEVATDFLRWCGADQHGDEEEGATASVRVGMEDLLERLRRTAVRDGYFARWEDAAIFADEIGAMLLSRRARFAPALCVVAEQGAQVDGGHWRSDPERGSLRDEPNGSASDGQRLRLFHTMTLDDANLQSLLAGREDQTGEGILLALSDAFLGSAEKDRGDSDRQTAAGALLECIADVLLRRADVCVRFADAIQRCDPLGDGEGGDVAGAATLQLPRFLTLDGRLDLSALEHAAALIVTALEVGVDEQVYPDEEAALRAHNERRLAIGMSGAREILLLAETDRDPAAARSLIGCLSSLLSGTCYWQSARIAETCPVLLSARPTRHAESAGTIAPEEEHAGNGSCPSFRLHRDEVLACLRRQRAQANAIEAPALQSSTAPIPIRRDLPIAGHEGAAAKPLLRQLPEMLTHAKRVWDGALSQAEHSGLRNIGVSGGESVPLLGSTAAKDSREAGKGWIWEEIEMDATDQVRVLAACAPFLSATLPPVVEVQADCSARQAVEIVLEAWRGGLAGISLLPRNRHEETDWLTSTEQDESEAEVVEEGGDAADGTGSLHGKIPVSETPERVMRPEVAGPIESPHRPERLDDVSREAIRRGMTLAEAEQTADARRHTALVETQLHRISELEEQLRLVQARALENGEAYDAKEPPRAMRHRLPAERASVTHKFAIAGHEGYITVGLYPNGSPGEIFLRMTKESSAVSGLLDAFATSVSLSLQHGVPLRVLAEHFAETRFEPAGPTINEQISYALSITDYLFRWMELRFLSGRQMDLFANLSAAPPQGGSVPVTGTVSGPKSSVVPNLHAAPKGRLD